MVSVIENVWRQALRTFENRVSIPNKSFEDNFALLKSLADKITASDVKLDTNLLHFAYSCDKPQHLGKPPTTYIDIYEDHRVTIGIFILKPGVKIPLHDHPQMYGILKVLSGTVKIQSYNVVDDGLTGTTMNTLIDQNILLAEKLPEVILTETNCACVLTPNDSNLHEIQSVNGPAAFLDILAPPYDKDAVCGDRSCHYFEEMLPKEKSKNKIKNIFKKVVNIPNTPENITRLYNIPSPPEYWNDRAPYIGPTLSL